MRLLKLSIFSGFLQVYYEKVNTRFFCLLIASPILRVMGQSNEVVAIEAKI